MSLAEKKDVQSEKSQQLGFLDSPAPEAKPKLVESGVVEKKPKTKPQKEKPKGDASQRASSSTSSKPKKKLAPMLQQYVDIKKDYQEHILLFQVGDFYEVFFEDAVTAADVLGIRLTSRDKDQENPIAMCGVPHHALENYLPKLLSAGFSCVVVSQVEDAKQAKGMVRRAITRIVTPGVRFEGDGLDEKHFNYLSAACVAPSGMAAVSYIDVSTGHLRIREAETLDELLEVLRRIHPAELILPSTLFSQPLTQAKGGTTAPWLRDIRALARELETKIVSRPFSKISRTEASSRVQELLAEDSMGSSVASAVEKLSEAGRAVLEASVEYIEEVSFGSSPGIARFSVEEQSRTVFIDATTRRNLEISETRLSGERRNSLLAHIDYTRTAMGSRMFGEWFLSPSAVQEEIEERFDVIEEFLSQPELLESLRQEFASIRDIDRLVTRLRSLRASPRDLATLRDSLLSLPEIDSILARGQAARIRSLALEFDVLEDVRELLQTALVEEPPLRVSEGGIFRDSYNEEVDRLRGIRANGKTWLAELEAEEKERSSIGALKIKYNNVFGYFIEVSKAHLSKVPQEYERKQTLTNAERFVTPKLKEYEVAILSAKGKQLDLERDLFTELRSKVCEAAGRLQKVARILSELDAISAFAELARRHNYVRPTLQPNSQELRVTQGRHPVVERVIGPHNFVPNDILLSRESRRLAVLTGPNMGGKSTYLRQIALIQLMAQAGSFVPAVRAELPLVDRIFTRIGASDDLSKGDSTFMVEMREASIIVRKATANSLVLIDEIGRGTATSDGLAIATAIAQWLHDNVECMTVFATHFHELTELEKIKEAAFCLSVGVVENSGEISFTHRIEETPADRSYGIEVARLAGLPEGLLCHAEVLLEELASGDSERATALSVDSERATALSVPKPSLDVSKLQILTEENKRLRRLEDALCAVNVDELTPLAALNELAALRGLLK